ncbi:SDR family oxidoreductase [Streptomyces sp. NPDC052701]|uniref:SDR family oxidoreductase n=1 Tax=Streptomyces sp. NPDC052701 TaxID=3155533 RepID=UPI0034142C88
MTGHTLDTDVIVVGAGPVGLMLAGELRTGGARVTVLERLAEPTTESRASTLHARTMELLDARGLLDRFGTLPRDTRGHFGGIPLDLTLPGPYPGQWKVPQTRTEAVLAQWAVSLGADLRRGHEVTALTEHRDTVEVTAERPGASVRLRARYVVGCDGEHSTVRRLAGIDFPGHDAARELIRADIAGIDVPDRRFERLDRGLAIAARRGDGVTRVMVHAYGRRPRSRAGAPDFAEVCEVWRHVTGEDIGDGTPLWLNAFGDASRLAARYRAGRVLLAGDAAHQQMPVGGQALNLGLQDAVNLGWKLAAVVRGRAPEGLLDTYHRERHAVGARVLAGIEAQAALLLGGPEVEAMRSVLAELRGHERVRRHLAGTISGLDVRYDLGTDGHARPGTRDPETETGAEAETDGHALLGARLEPAELVTDRGTTTTAALLRSGRGLLLDLRGDRTHHARLRRECGPWLDRVDLVAAEPGPAGAPGGRDAFLVRPDGHVVWTASASGPDGPAAALEAWFGPPASAPGAPEAARPLPARPRPAPHGDERHSQTQHHRGRGGDTQMGRLTGRTALVTGASRGIGRAIAVRLAAEGALVAVHYAANRDAAEEVVTAIEKDGGRAFAVQAELGVPGDVHELFLGLEEGLKERTGSTELNILVNNAGRMGGVPVEKMTPEEFDRLFAVNAKAPFFLIQRALANLAQGGRIINISSGLTRFANPDEIAYAMTKGAVEQLALHFAKVLAPRGITINSVAPGITRNGNPLFDVPEAVEQMAQLSAFNRVGEPEDVADVVAFLASDDSRWVTGAFLDATGGTLLG